MSHEYERPTGAALYTIFGALMLGMFLAALDQTVVATVLPTIVGALAIVLLRLHLPRHLAFALTWLLPDIPLRSSADAP